MANLESRVPQGSASTNEPVMGYAEKQLVGSYMNVESMGIYDCQTCNNCGSGDCASCCGSTDN